MKTCLCAFCIKEVAADVSRLTLKESSIRLTSVATIHGFKARRILGRILSLILLGLALNLTAADLPELVLPQGVGVNIHFTRGHERDLDLIAAAGFKFIRMDFSWGGTERKKGEYNWAEYDELTANLEKRGLRAIYILDYSNGLYEEAVTEKDERGVERKVTPSPQHPESVAAFARWAGEAAKHFRGRRIIWEIWNEPNISFWKPKPDVQQYIALAKATCAAVRANDPQATIIAPASSEFPWAFLEAMFQAGLLEQLDAVSVHPYRNYKRPPETAAEEYQKLRALIERHASPAKRGMPIISGEWGYATHDKGVSLETQAAFIVRQQLANLLNDIPLSIWYDWKNDGQDPAYNEHNFGTVTHDLKPKPAYEALQVMAKQLAGYRIAHRLAGTAKDDYVLLCVNAGGDQKLAAWTLGEEHETAVASGLASSDGLSIVDGKGQPQPVIWRGKQFFLRLSNLPQYVTFGQRSRFHAAAAAWKIESPSRSYTAGVKDGLAVTLSVQNPFAHPVTATASLRGHLKSAPNNSSTKKLQLTPGKSARVTVAVTEYQRDLSQTPMILAVNMSDAAGTPIGGWTNDVLFTALNPLELSAAPLEQGLRVRVHSPTGAPFIGMVQAGAEKQRIALTAASPTATVDLRNQTGDQPVKLLDQSGQLAGQWNARRFQRLEVAGYKAALDGDAKVPAKATIQMAAPPEKDSPGTKVFALDYECAEGWRFVRCEAQTAKPIVFEGRPVALGMWVYGDGSGNVLRARVRDTAGQTFQPNGPNLDWRGWRWVEFDLADLSKAGHWGGANDGVAKGNLTLDTPLLVDMNRRQTAGRVYFSGAAAVFGANGSK